jgi:hypothetical protein
LHAIIAVHLYGKQLKFQTAWITLEAELIYLKPCYIKGQLARSKQCGRGGQMLVFLFFFPPFLGWSKV